MTKLILKTTAITLATILGVIALIFGALALFLPKSLARFFDGMGAESIAVVFYENQYKKTGDINDLAQLVIKMNVDKDAEKSEQYYQQFISHENYDNHCNEQDIKDGGVQSVTANEFYYGRYVLMLYDNGKDAQAILTCKQFVSKYGYLEFNPYRCLLNERAQLLNSTQLNQIRNNLLEITVEMTDQEKGFVSEDVLFIQQLQNI